MTSQIPSPDWAAYLSSFFGIDGGFAAADSKKANSESGIASNKYFIAVMSQFTKTLNITIVDSILPFIYKKDLYFYKPLMMAFSGMSIVYSIARRTKTEYKS